MAFALSSSVIVISVVVGVPALISLVSAIPVGGIILSYGMRNASLLGLFSLIALSLAMPYISSLLGLLVFTCLLGLSYQLVYTALKVHLMELAPRGKSSKYFSILATVFQAGLVVGPVLGGYLILGGLSAGILIVSRLIAFDFLLVFVLLTVFGVGAGAKMKKGIFKDTLAKSFTDGVGEYLKLGGVGVVVLWLTVVFTSYEGLVWAFEPLFSRFYGLNTLTTGLILSMFTLPFIFFSIPAGILADRYGKVKVLAPSIMVSGIFIVAFGLVEDPVLLMAFALVSTTGLAFAWSSMAGLLVDASKRFEKMFIVGVWNMSEGFGYLVGPVLGGLFAQFLSVKAPFIILGVLMVFTSIVIVLLFRRYLLSAG